MSQVHPFPPSGTVPHLPVTLLDCRGLFDFDPRPLSELAAGSGRRAAEDIAPRVLEDLALRLGGLQTARQTADFAQLPKQALRIAAVGEQIGLCELACAARHVATSADQADGVAVEATSNRLERAFDLAVTQIWSEVGLF
ncbi:MAG: hypothetical protein ABR504_08240 [Paracoccaceae bacterium]